jgi:hypothetical protein
MSLVIGMALGLILIAVGVVLGAALAHAGAAQGEKKTPPAEPKLAISAAMGADRLTRTAAVLAQLDPSAAEKYVAEMEDTALLQIHVLAGLHLLGSSPEFVRQAQAVADAWMASESWKLPAADR